jgi:hypothetical protein
LRIIISKTLNGHSRTHHGGVEAVFGCAESHLSGP